MNDTRTQAFHIDVVLGPTGHGTVKDYELFYARRALRLFKTRLGRQGLLDLLADDIEKGNAFIRQAAQDSNGEFRAATTVLAVAGLTAAQFTSWLDGNITTNEPAMLAAHPEHFAMGEHPLGGAFLVENFGPHVCSSIVHFGRNVEWATSAAEYLPDDQYPVKKIATIELEDGTLIGRVLSQFGDTEGGFSASMSIYFPAACPDELIEHHRRHLAVEFSNWITAAAAAQADVADNKE